MLSTGSSTALRGFRLAASARYCALPSSSSLPASNASARSFSRSALVFNELKKPSIKAIAELRRLVPGTSMLKAKEALLASRPSASPDEDPIPLALEWLEADRKKSGAKKADKIAGRQAREGVVAVTVLTDGLPSSVELKGQLKDEAKSAGIGATSAAAGAIVEVNCETDFVAKNEVFAQLVKDIVHTVALFPTLTTETTSLQGGFVDVPVEQLLAFPLLPSSPEATGSSVAPKTVGSAIIDVVSRLGEKISIARAAAILPPTVPSPDAERRSVTGTAQGGSIVDLASAFAHGGSSGFAAAKDALKPGYVLTSGKVASLLMTRFSSPQLPDALAAADGAIQTNIRALTRSLARQVAGLETKSISSSSVPESRGEVSSVLYEQPFMMLLPAAAPSPESNSQSVQDVLTSWASHNKLESQGGVVQVVDMHRWELGETAAPAESTGEGFAEEVRKAAGLA